MERKKKQLLLEGMDILSEMEQLEVLGGDDSNKGTNGTCSNGKCKNISCHNGYCTHSNCTNGYCSDVGQCENGWGVG